MKHNNALPNVHYRKEWDLRVKTWLDQPMRKHRRRVARKAKAAAVFPRPVSALRPVVRGQTVRYNTKVRAGKGFTLAELKAAGLTQARAKQVGVAIDHRRTNKSQESLDANVQRLKEYLSKLVIVGYVALTSRFGSFEQTFNVCSFCSGKDPRARFGEVAAASAGSLKQVSTLPIKQDAAKLEFVTVTEDMKKARSYRKLRQEWTNARLVGFRNKKAQEAAAKAEKAPAADAE